MPIDNGRNGLYSARHLSREVVGFSEVFPLPDNSQLIIWQGPFYLSHPFCVCCSMCVPRGLSMPEQREPCWCRRVCHASSGVDAWWASTPITATDRSLPSRNQVPPAACHGPHVLLQQQQHFDETFPSGRFLYWNPFFFLSFCCLWIFLFDVFHSIHFFSE